MFWRVFSEGVLKICIFIGTVVALVIGALTVTETESILLGILTCGGLILFNLIGCSTLGMIVEALTHLESLNAKLGSIERTLATFKSAPMHEGYGAVTVHTSTDTHNTSTAKFDPLKDWCCKKCSTKNEKTKPFCKNCGEYK